MHIYINVAVGGAETNKAILNECSVWSLAMYDVSQH